MADIKLSKTKQQLYDAVVAEMKKGELPWNKPWHGGPISAPENATTGARYKGINNILLFVEALRNEYTDNRWATFKQIQDNGWHLIKGSKGVPIEFYSKYDVVAKKKMNDRDIKALTAGMSEADAAAWEKQHIKTIGDTYIVFNAAQIEGIKQRDALTVTAEERNLQCENFIAASECPIFYDQVGRAYYDATKDEIHLPTEADFKSLTDRYATTFHEMAHSSGAEKRLNRDMSGVFLTPSYAKEELRAEVASMFLQQEYGVDMQQRSLANHSSYLQGWLNVITDNPNELFNAFHDASKIANYLVLNERAYTKEHAAQRSVEAAAVTQTMSIAQQSQPQDAPAYTDYYKAYLDVERKNPDAIVATRLGDFYEVMGDKAQVAADILDLILVTRDVANGVRVPMTGFPARIADNYIETLNKTHDVVILEDGTVRTLANTSLAAERAAEDFLLDEYLDSASNHEFTIENNLHNLELPSFIREETARKIVEYANTKTEKELCAEYQVLCAMSRVVNEELSYAVGMDDISEEHYVREQVFSKLSQVEMSQEMFSKFGQLEVSQQELNSLYPELVDKYARHLSEGTLETYGWDTDSVKNSIISYLPSEYQALVEQEKSAQKSVEAAAATQTTNIEQQSEPQDAPAYTDYYKAYLDVERKNPDAIVATRLGDFYEVMGDKAQAVAFFLDLALVTRQVADGVRVPMAGFPAYASDNYLSTLTEIHDVVILEDGAVSTMKRRDNTASATNVSRAISMGDIHDEMIFDALNRAKEGDFSDIANSNSFSFNEFWDVYWIKAEKATSTQIGVSYEKVERKLFKTTRTDEILWLDKDNVKVENGYLTEVKLATLIGSVAYTDQLVSHSSLKSTYNKWLEQSKTPRKVAEDTPEKRADYASKLQQWDDYNKLMALQAARRAEEDLRLEEYQAAAEKREFATNNNLHNLEVPDLVDIADATKIVEYANTKTAKELCAEYLVVCAMSKVVNDELSYAVGMDGLSNELYAREQMFSKFSQVEMSQQELNSLYPALVDKYARYLGGGALETYGWEDASVAKSIVSYLPSEYQALARQEELVEKRATQAKEYARLTEKYGNIDFETQLYVSTYWTENLNTNERTYSLYEIDPNSEDGEKITRTKTPINFAELNTFGKELHLIEDEYDYQQLRDIAADTELYATLKAADRQGELAAQKSVEATADAPTRQVELNIEPAAAELGGEVAAATVAQQAATSGAELQPTPPAANLTARQQAELKANLQRIDDLVANVPPEMKAQEKWCTYKYYWDKVKNKDGTEKLKANGKPEWERKKKLIDVATGSWASSADKKTWTSFDKAVEYARANGLAGVAYALNGKETCVDLDHSIGKNGELSKKAQELLALCGNTYVEKSVSGTGIHIFVTDTIGSGYNSRSAEVECYSAGRIMSMTGDLYQGERKLSKMPDELKDKLRKEVGKQPVRTEQSSGYKSAFTDDEVIERLLSNGRTSRDFSALMNGGDITGDISKDDFSFCRMVASYTTDEAQVERIFRQHRYRQSKGEKYVFRTVAKAVAQVQDTGRSASARQDSIYQSKPPTMQLKR